MENNIGSIIKKIRKENNISQQRLADMLNTTNTAISKWESGKTTPDIYYIKEIAKLFNLSIDELLNNQGKTNNKKTRIINIIIIICIFIIIIQSVLIINLNNIQIYNLKSLNNDIVTKGLIINTNNKLYMLINSIEYNNQFTGTEEEIIPEYLTITIKSNDKTIYYKEIDNNERKRIEDIIKTINIEYTLKEKEFKDLKLIMKCSYKGKIEIVTTKIIPYTSTIYN